MKAHHKNTIAILAVAALGVILQAAPASARPTKGTATIEMRQDIDGIYSPHGISFDQVENAALQSWSDAKGAAVANLPDPTRGTWTAFRGSDGLWKFAECVPYIGTAISLGEAAYALGMELFRQFNPGVVEPLQTFHYLPEGTYGVIMLPPREPNSNSLEFNTCYGGDWSTNNMFGFQLTQAGEIYKSSTCGADVEKRAELISVVTGGKSISSPTAYPGTWTKIALGNYLHRIWVYQAHDGIGNARFFYKKIGEFTPKKINSANEADALEAESMDDLLSRRRGRGVNADTGHKIQHIQPGDISIQTVPPPEGVEVYVEQPDGSFVRQPAPTSWPDISPEGGPSPTPAPSSEPSASPSPSATPKPTPKPKTRIPQNIDFPDSEKAQEEGTPEHFIAHFWLTMSTKFPFDWIFDMRDTAFPAEEPDIYYISNQGVTTDDILGEDLGDGSTVETYHDLNFVKGFLRWAVRIACLGVVIWAIFS